MAGMRFMWLSGSTSSSAIFGVNLGIEAGIGAEYHFTDRVYVFGRLRGVYDFYSFSFIDTTVLGGSVYTGFYTYTVKTKNSGFISSFGLNPNIGIGFKL
jgi:hypothetical protein